MEVKVNGHKRAAKLHMKDSRTLRESLDIIKTVSVLEIEVAGVTQEETNQAVLVIGKLIAGLPTTSSKTHKKDGPLPGQKTLFQEPEQDDEAA